MSLKHTRIDKDYMPLPGDVLSNEHHPLIIIEGIYYLNKTSSKVNRNYNDQIVKHELLKKIITRKEAIWNQHKLDYTLFPERTTNNQTGGDKRNNINYQRYCFYNDQRQYVRLYKSRYTFPPTSKIRVVTGKKTMMRVNHGLCKSNYVSADGTIGTKSCTYWYGRQSMPLTLLVSKGFIYHGNVYNDTLQQSDASLSQNES